MSHRRITAILTAVAASLALRVAAPHAQIDTVDPAAIKTAIERAFTIAPRDFQALTPPSQAGVRVLVVAVERTAPAAQRITIDLSQRALTYDPSGDVEALIDHALRSTAPLTGGGDEIDYRFLIDGLPLEQFLSRVTPRVRPQALGNSGRVVVSPGHGWYWHAASGTWRLQRDYFWGIVEDVVNWDIASYVRNELSTANIEVRPARYPDRDATMGASGYPEWQESATYFIKALGAPPEVWNIGIDDYARDINSRPFYANWIDSAIMVSIHNNGGGGTGTETWYDATNGQEAESRRLAEAINRKVVAAIRSRYNPNWPDRGLRTCNGCKGENRLAARPAVIVETAFMDMKSPDNDALHDETFKQIVAQAIREGIQEFASDR